MANAGPDQVVEATSPDGASVALDGSASTDPDGDLLTYFWNESATEIATGVNPSVVLALGTYDITLTVIDPAEASDSDDVEVKVVTDTPPDISVSVTPNELWPENHKMVEIVAAISVGDIADPAPSVVLVSVVSNEPDDAAGNGDGNTVDNIQGTDTGTDDRSFRVRAESAGGGAGRTYTATDASGNSATGSATITVPHDQGDGKANGRNE